MRSAQLVSGAVLIGVACGMRTFTGPAALAMRGRLGGARGRVVLAGIALGEAVGDKTSLVPPRTSAGALAARVLSGALSGRQLAGPAGIAAGAAGAIAGTVASHRARAALGRLTGLPDPVLGLAEDALAVAAAALATREEHEKAAGP